jgi:haloalkane dehalogenase
VVTPSHRPNGPRAPVDPQSASWSAEYPFASQWLDVGAAGNPMWLHYLDEGPRDAPVVVMLHGNPTWSFYYRKLVMALRETYRCIVPDHIGCGLSDRPQKWTYHLADHVDNVAKLVDHLHVDAFSLVVHDWGGAIGMGLATERPDAVTSSIVFNTAAFRSPEIPPSIASIRIPVFGRVAVLNFNAFAGVATYRAMHKHERMTKTVKAGYLAPYGNAHDRIATLRFVEDIPMDLGHPSYGRLLQIEQKLPLLQSKPMMLVWGERDFCFTPKFRARWQQEFPNATVHALEDAGHYVVEDAHERIIPWMQEFLAKHA